MAPKLSRRGGLVEPFIVMDVMAAAAEKEAGGETVIDPEVVRQLLSRRRDHGPLSALTEREREVLALMAEGRTNRLIAEAQFVSEAAVRKHVGNIFAKLGLGTGTDRRVLAVLTYLRGR